MAQCTAAAIPPITATIAARPMNVSVDDPVSLELLELRVSELGAFSELVLVEPISIEPVSVEPVELSELSGFSVLSAFWLLPVLSVLAVLKELAEASVLGAC